MLYSIDNKYNFLKDIDKVILLGFDYEGIGNEFPKLKFNNIFRKVRRTIISDNFSGYIDSMVNFHNNKGYFSEDLLYYIKESMEEINLRIGLNYCGKLLPHRLNEYFMYNKRCLILINVNNKNLRFYNKLLRELNNVTKLYIDYSKLREYLKNIHFRQ